MLTCQNPCIVLLFTHFPIISSLTVLNHHTFTTVKRVLGAPFTLHSNLSWSLCLIRVHFLFMCVCPTFKQPAALGFLSVSVSLMFLDVAGRHLTFLWSVQGIFLGMAHIGELGRRPKTGGERWEAKWKVIHICSGGRRFLRFKYDLDF